jgi:hypothetical protein
MDGGSIRKLSEILGHGSVETTEHHAHLSPDAYSGPDYEKVVVDLKPGGRVVEVSFGGRPREERDRPELGTNQVTGGDEARENSL